MRVFHFLPEKWALIAIKNQMLKVSSFDDLNDPFELLAMSLPDRDSRQVMLRNKAKLSSKLRLLCCSENWESPLLWGHYAEKHKGVALELEVDDDLLHKVSYETERPKLNLHSLVNQSDEYVKQTLKKLMVTKYKEWEYENEQRVIFTEDEVFQNRQGLDFIKLGKGIKITGLIKGVMNNTSNTSIEKHIPNGCEMKIVTSRVAFNSYRIVTRKDKPIVKLKGN